ncbi:MAG TPA: hypothetical protein VF282_04270 [Bacillota bacterium]
MLQVVLIAGMIAGAAGFVYATGGTGRPYLHILYVPVILAAFAGGTAGGLSAGLADLPFAAVGN